MEVEQIAETAGWFLLAATLFRVTISSLQVVRQRVSTRRRTHSEREEFRSLFARTFDQLGSIPGVSLQTGSGKRPFRIVRRFFENLDQSICTFDLVPIDGAEVPAYKPGQFITLELVDPASGSLIRRCYSISEAPNSRQDYYRITVKRLDARSLGGVATSPGVASNLLHDSFLEGDTIDVLPPSGEFYLDQTSERPVVLIAGGVGITPLLSMFIWLAKTQSTREVWLFYGVRNENEQAFATYIKKICQHRSNMRVVVFYSRPGTHSRRGVDYDAEGHVTVEAMKPVLNARNYEFYVCGPSGMMKSIRSQLLAWGVPADDIKSEAFFSTSPSNSMPPRQQRSPQTIGIADLQASEFTVEFSRSRERVVWSPSNGSLLELAESSGIDARCLCRAGQCGTCKVKVKSGDVTYMSEPGATLEAGSCLPCVAQPASDPVLGM